MRVALRDRCDVIRPRDVIGHVTIRLSIDDFLNRNQTVLSLNFRYI